MSTPRFMPPMDIGTGMPCYQPCREQRVPGWDTDRNLRWQETAFIDAPAYLPAGGTRAVDCSPITLACAHLLRPGTF